MLPFVTRSPLSPVHPPPGRCPPPLCQAIARQDIAVITDRGREGDHPRMTASLTPTRPVGHAGVVPDAPDPEVTAKARRRRFSAAYKLRIVAEYDAATESGAKGALLRREGLYSSHVIEWRRAQQAGALEALDRKRGRKPADEREAELARLRRRLERAEAELAKAQKVIDVQGKWSCPGLVDIG